MIRSLLTLSLVSTSLISKASEQANSFQLFYTDKGHPYVYADIEQQKQIPMILDSAANMGVLPMKVKEQLNLPQEAFREMEVQGAVGAHNLELVNVQNTSLDKEKVSNLDYLFRDLNGIEVKNGALPGILGHGFLSRYCVDMNFVENNLGLSKSQCDKESTEGLREASFYIEDNFIKIKTTFNGKVVDAILDTGAPNSYVNTPLFDMLDVELFEKDVARGLNREAIEKQKLGEVFYSIGTNQISENDMFVSNMPVFTALGYKDEPVLLLGLSYFKNNKLVIDYHANKIYF